MSYTWIEKIKEKCRTINTIWNCNNSLAYIFLLSFSFWVFFKIFKTCLSEWNSFSFWVFFKIFKTCLSEGNSFSFWVFFKIFKTCLSEWNSLSFWVFLKIFKTCLSEWMFPHLYKKMLVILSNSEVCLIIFHYSLKF